MNVVIVPAALAELQAAADYYELNGGVDLARALVVEFERVINLVVSCPQLGMAFRGKRRRYFLTKFPYSLIYQVTDNQLRVLAFAHQRRRPNYWAKRE